MERKYKNRLLKLADFLETVPPKRFRFSSWVGDDWQGREDLSCGTTACAVGWASTIPAFRKLGLRLKRDRAGQAHPCLKNVEPDSVGWSYFGESPGGMAAGEIFGEESVSKMLFWPGGWGARKGICGDDECLHDLHDKPTAKQFAQRIRRFVEAHGE